MKNLRIEIGAWLILTGFVLAVSAIIMLKAIQIIAALATVAVGRLMDKFQDQRRAALDKLAESRLNAMQSTQQYEKNTLKRIQPASVANAHPQTKYTTKQAEKESCSQTELSSLRSVDPVTGELKTTQPGQRNGDLPLIG
jgi:type II secretory pathway pseudopilin PulG